jgi:hypothetical protein
MTEEWKLLEPSIYRLFTGGIDIFLAKAKHFAGNCNSCRINRAVFLNQIVVNHLIGIFIIVAEESGRESDTAALFYLDNR